MSRNRDGFEMSKQDKEDVIYNKLLIETILEEIAREQVDCEQVKGYLNRKSRERATLKE